jgi:hypothetical protein
MTHWLGISKRLRQEKNSSSTAAFYMMLLCTCLLYEFGYCQSEQLLKLPAHTYAHKVPWWDSVYRFPEFQQGKITFSTGFSPSKTLKLNYNLYTMHLDMITDRGDTLQVIPSKEIKLIDIGGHLFYYDSKKGYIEILHQSRISLGVVTGFRTEKMVYVSGNPSGSVNLDVRGQPSVYDRYYSNSRSYFFIDEENKLYLATKFNIVKLFPDYKRSIHAYLEENHIDFTRAQDIIQLLNFCNQLNRRPEHDKSGLLSVKGGMNIVKVWGDSLYRFPNFQDAIVTFQDNPELLFERAVNYNLLTGEMDVINKNGDTVKVKNPGTIKNITIDQHIFHHDDYHGYVEVLLNSTVSLGVSKILDIQVQNGEASDNSSKFAGMRSGKNFKDPTVDYDRTFKKKNTYFFIKDLELYPADKLSIVTLYPKKRATISAYIKQNAIDFEKERDLKSLLSFCNGLPPSNN